MDNSNLIVAGRGTVLLGPTDTEPCNIDLFDVNNPDTYKGWNLSQSSVDNMVEFSKDGGDMTVLDTWEQKAVQTTQEAITLSWTVSKVEMNRQVFEWAFGLEGNTWDEATKSYKVTNFGTTELAAFIIMIDPATGRRGGFYMPRNTVTVGDMPEFDNEKLFNIQLSGTALASGKDGTIIRPYQVRDFAGKSSKVTTGGNAPSGATTKPAA